MKFKVRSAMLLIVVVMGLLVSCGEDKKSEKSTATTAAPSPETTASFSPTETTAQTIDSLEALIVALTEAGLSVEEDESVDQPFLNTEGQLLTINKEASLQVFVYDTEADATTDADTIAPNGGSAGTSMLAWLDTPHFYRSGKMIVIYVGSDTMLISVLENILGPQFAGR